MGNWLDKTGLTQIKGILTSKFATKVDKYPSNVPSGKFLQTDSNGDAVWGNAPSQQALVDAAADWLDDHYPSRTEAVIDNTLLTANAAADAKATGELIMVTQNPPSTTNNPTNKLWFKNNGETEYTVPSYAEHEELKSALKQDELNIQSALGDTGDALIFTKSIGAAQGNVGSEISFSSSSNWNHTDILVNAGETYKITISSRGNDIQYVYFTNSSNVILNICCKFDPAEYPTNSLITFLVTVPQITGIAKMYVNGYGGDKIYSIKKIKNDKDYTDEEIERAKDHIVRILNPLNAVVDGYVSTFSEQAHGSIIGDVGDTISFSESVSWIHSFAEVNEGEVYRAVVHSRGSTETEYVVFTDNSGEILYREYGDYDTTEYPQNEVINIDILVPDIPSIKRMYVESYGSNAIILKRMTTEETIRERLEEISDEITFAVTATTGYRKRINNVTCEWINDTSVRIYGKRSVSTAMIFDCLNGQNDAFDRDNSISMTKNITEGEYICYIENVSGVALSYTDDLVGDRINLTNGSSFEVPNAGGSVFVNLGTGQVGDDVDITVHFSVYAYGNDYGLLNTNIIPKDVIARNQIEKTNKTLAEYIPDYYKQYIAGKADTVNGILGGNRTLTTYLPDQVDQFIWFTDYHFDPNEYKTSATHGDCNTKNSPGLMKYLLMHTGCNKILFGGDIANGYANEKTQKYLLDCFADFKETFQFARGKLFGINGNHEYNTLQDGYPSYGKLSQFLRGDLDNIVDEYDKYGDYILKVSSRKMWYVMINSAKNIWGDQSSPSTFEQIFVEQIMYVFSKLETVPNGYSVIIVTHSMLNMTGWEDGEMTWALYTNAGRLANGLIAFANRNQHTFNGVTYDFRNVNADIVCCLVGHTHVDTSYNIEISTGNNIPVIMTTCDSVRKRNKYYDHDNNVWVNADDYIGTYREQAFDVVTIDKKNHKIYTTRIGDENVDETGTHKASGDREFTYPSTIV